MKKLLLLLIISVAIMGCTTPENKTIATASKEKITQGDLDFEVNRLKKAMYSEDHVMTEEEKVEFETQVLNNIIMKKVFTKQLTNLEIQAPQEQIDQQWDQFKAQYESEAKMEEDIVAKGFTVEELKAEFTYQLQMQELSRYASEQEMEINEEEIQAFYNENKETIFAQPAMIKSASHILIMTKERTEEEALEKINAVKEDIIAGKSFSDAAKEYSEGPSGSNGGKLGGFQKGQMVPEFENVAFAIPLNTVSEPVLTQFGYHLILVENRSDATFAPYEETKEYISTQLKVKKFFEKIEKDANIKKPDWAKEKEVV